ncbi:MAG TPA: adenylate kinase [Candidatus Saccharimonadales bacterium]|jgi:adenylate kinase|nr:adenylate kinase [Candidatus Saccharimonadales bacterium]
MPHIAVVTGIPGVGKTTVLNELTDLAHQNKFDLVVLNYGTIMNEIMRDLGKELHRDDMRSQRLEMQRKVQELAANELNNRATQHNVLVIDTHMFVRTPSGMWAGIPQNLLQQLRPQLFVLVETDAQQIANRRQSDSARRRDQSLSSEITFDLEWSRATAAASAVITGAPVKIIRNEPGNQKQAAKDLFQTIQSIAA